MKNWIMMNYVDFLWIILIFYEFYELYWCFMNFTNFDELYWFFYEFYELYWCFMNFDELYWFFMNLINYIDVLWILRILMNYIDFYELDWCFMNLINYIDVLWIMLTFYEFYKLWWILCIRNEIWKIFQIPNNCLNDPPTEQSTHPWEEWHGSDSLLVRGDSLC